MAETAVVCGSGVAGIASAMGEGCTNCAGWVSAGCGMEMQGLVGALQCGCYGVWNSVIGLGTAFTQVLSHVVVNSVIAGVYLVAVFGQDTYHCSRDPNLAKGVIHGNWLTSIQGCKRFAAFVGL